MKRDKTHTLFFVCISLSLLYFIFFSLSTTTMSEQPNDFKTMCLRSTNSRFASLTSSSPFSNDTTNKPTFDDGNSSYKLTLSRATGNSYAHKQQQREEMTTEQQMQQFKRVTAKKYAEQAKFFLNAFWKEFSGEAENIWQWTLLIAKLDDEKKAEGCDLDEFKAHIFLEKLGETKRVVELREELRAIDMDKNRRMALIEFLLFKFGQSIQELLSRPQGTDEEMEKAQAALDTVQTEINKIETKKTALKAVADGPAGVKANAAANELEQLLKSDPTDLNRAIISAEAAVRKAQKNPSLAAAGTSWFLSRELEESRKYKPSRKTGA